MTKWREAYALQVFEGRWTRFPKNLDKAIVEWGFKFQLHLTYLESRDFFQLFVDQIRVELSTLRHSAIRQDFSGV